MNSLITTNLKMCKALKLGKPDCSKEKCQYTLSLLLFLTAIFKV